MYVETGERHRRPSTSTTSSCRTCRPPRSRPHPVAEGRCSPPTSRSARRSPPRRSSASTAQLLTKHFSSVTPGNALKWDATEPTEGAFRWTDADPLVNFAVANGLKVRGHTLVWHQQTPAWVFNDAAGQPMTATAANKALLLTRLRGAHPGGDGPVRRQDRRLGRGQRGHRREPVRRAAAQHLVHHRRAGLHPYRVPGRPRGRPAAKLYINDYNTNVRGQARQALRAGRAAQGRRACRSTASVTRCTATWTGRRPPTPTR